MFVHAFLCLALATPQEPSADLAPLVRGGNAELQRVIAMGEAAIPGLAALLQDPAQDGVTRFMAANLLGDIRSPKAVEALIAALGDEFYNVRRCAALALGKIRDERAKAPLEELAANDPFVWKDPATGEERWLVRDDARQALDVLAGRATSAISGLVKEEDTFLVDASTPPHSPVRVPIRKLPFPFPGDFAAQNVFNNYQQPTESYVHAALDVMQPAGTEVRAVEGGVVAAIATNYPEWRTHHVLVVAPTKDADVGWCYTHVDPDTYAFAVGDEVRAGQVLGKVVDFYVGKDKGADHLHLQYARFERKEDGTIDVTSLVDPLHFFDWKDEQAPAIAEPIRFVRAGSVQEFGSRGGAPPTVAGDVDVVAGITESGIPGQGCNWMVPVVTIEIRGEDAEPWRKLVLDQRGEIPQPRAAPALYVKADDARRQRWLDGMPAFPPVHFLYATHTDGDGTIEPADALQAWRTTELTPEGARRFPNGLYEVTIRAWDLQGNKAERTAKVRVENR